MSHCWASQRAGPWYAARHVPYSLCTGLVLCQTRFFLALQPAAQLPQGMELPFTSDVPAASPFSADGAQAQAAAATVHPFAAAFGPGTGLSGLPSVSLAPDFLEGLGASADLAMPDDADMLNDKDLWATIFSSSAQSGGDEAVQQLNGGMPNMNGTSWGPPISAPAGFTMDMQ